MKKTLVSLAMLGTFVSSAWADTSTMPTCDNPIGSWRNELGSTMKIDAQTKTITDSKKNPLGNTGPITGTYISPSGTSGQEFPLSGWFYAALRANSDKDKVALVTFSVNWNNAPTPYNSITTWSGLCRVTNNVPTITALYYYANALAEYPWKHVNVGQDVFQPIAP
ncbi:avidin/streptavidin family protein [Burkholderia pseudomallei]|uniref:avidin/streptavidin family protein n=1 Tax=Burkholderia pseudomallei TaxID=28450 RepID=UPI000531FB8C|nr:avidin/streptavidin family protein [Burkholderia pseudomallei]AJX75992.1 avidin family protein [Burkholderia pseudomallei MSHR2543]KGS86890.1 avidin family protein [Burkholderia pseudomallei MSHR5596]MBM5691526.1 avidin [Burkholderia pseudomallei]